MCHVKREVNGEIDNYRFLRPWQWTSIKQLEDADVDWKWKLGENWKQSDDADDK